MLQDARLFFPLTIYFDLVTYGVILVGYEGNRPFVAVVVDECVLGGDSCSRERNGWLEGTGLLTNEVVSFVESELEHARQVGILVDVLNLWRGLQSRLIKLHFLHLLLLGF